MVALADGVADYVSGAAATARRSFVGGVGRGMDFQTNNSRDMAAYATELDGMGEFEELTHYAGVAIGEILNAASLGTLERNSHRKLTVGGSEWYDINLGGNETAEEYVNAMAKAYLASGGTFDEDGQGDREGDSDLEASVGGAGRESSNDNGYDAGEEDSDESDDYAETNNNEGNRNRRPRGNAEDAEEILQYRIQTQEAGLVRNLDALRTLSVDDVIARVESGYMSTVGVPYVEGTHDSRRPGRERDLTYDEIESLVNGIIAPDYVND